MKLSIWQIFIWSWTIVIFISSPVDLHSNTNNKDLPNILWITSEDNSPMLGCYGDSLANTPNLDKMASQGILYENAFANAPVCAPARSTIITGMYACSMGTHNMRSRYSIPAFIRLLPEYLHGAGYYCINRSKTDYNIAGEDKIVWDESSKTAHYKNRKPGQPFFCVFNNTVTHESSIHKRQKKIRHDPLKVLLPSYHPDTPEIRLDWAQYYDKVEDLDFQVGTILDKLEKDGLMDNTIIFYFSDHGGILCRSKRFLYDTGVHVPMIIQFPEKFQHLAPGKPGERTDRVVSFVDLAPTVLSLANIKIPDYMQGHAFLGPQQQPPQSYAYLFRNRMDERLDMMRAVRDKSFKYIRNYMPHRIYGQHLNYLWRSPNTRSWEKEFRGGRCNEVQSLFWQTKPSEELYDITKDPWEVDNLADNPEYRDVLERMRRASMKWTREIHDIGFIPEGEMIKRSKEMTNFELVQTNGFPMERIIETAEIASTGDVKMLPELINRISDEESSVRYWATTGIVILGKEASTAESILLKALNDESGDVRIAAAEALCNIGRKESALPVLEKEIFSSNPKVALYAINVLNLVVENTQSLLPTLEKLNQQCEDKYVKRCISYMIGKNK